MTLELNWKNTQLQTKPATQNEFATAISKQRVVPVNIFPMEDGSGVAPVCTVTGATFDPPRS